MAYTKENLYDTALPTIVIHELDKYTKYPQIGRGSEGSVHRYDDKTMFKIFDFTKDKSKLPQKFKKIEMLGTLHDESFCFPKGLIGYQDKFKEGYYADLVVPHPEYGDFDKLRFKVQLLKGIKEALECIKKADAAIQRAHELGLILGDIKGDNIMIDEEGNPKFVDTDNYAYGDFGFDLEPARAKMLSYIFKKQALPTDNDKFTFALLAISILAPQSMIQIKKSPNYFKWLIKLLDISPEMKDGLSLILSDAENKPYIGEVLSLLNPEQELLSNESINRLIMIR